MPPRRHPQVHRLDEVYEGELEQRFMARMKARLDQMVDQLTNRMKDLVNRRERQPGTPLQMDDDDFKNVFGDGDNLSSKGIMRMRVRRVPEIDRGIERLE
ncbi:hypothetical protein L6452_22753 [Arctium lappa]|uniref:Uncharacterized protein n=1 Tax=Arctium lappa TaxID=4217 RepID=A0ACB9B1X9_ARCLA|nr:hypothetical protein L6452_22753 [Arctium lappa]